MMATFKRKPRPPATFTYASGEPAYSVYGWTVSVSRKVTEFSELANASAKGFQLKGSGTAAVTTAALYTPRSVHRATVRTATATKKVTATADKAGRLRFTGVSLGPSNATQQDTPGATTKVFTATVTVAR
jgi:hypothetical protein